jgi:glycosyltransferase involved in cell wall biosynthesis
MSERPMRVLHLLNSVTGWGCGIVNAALDIVAGQQRLGCEVAVCSGEGEFTAILERQGIRHFSLNQDRSIANFSRAFFALRRIVREFQPDIVHCHMVTGMVLARAVRLTTNFALVAHIHNVHQRSSVAMGLADSVIAVSEAVGTDMAARGVRARKIRVVHNGMLGSFRLSDTEQVTPRALAQPAVVTVAGMNHRKGIAELIVAFERVVAEVPDCHLYLVGRGPDEDEFRNRAARSPAKLRIHFEGFQENPLEYMKAATVFVLASRRDSFPLVLPEARQCGCAIVGTNVDGIPEALEGGRAGVLVPAEDPAALAEALTRLLKDSGARRQLQEAAGRNLDHFRVERVAAETEAVYRELLGRHSSSAKRMAYRQGGDEAARVAAEPCGDSQ